MYNTKIYNFNSISLGEFGSVKLYRGLFKRGLVKKGGRNNQGIMTSRHRGGGIKRCYRNVSYHLAGYNCFYVHHIIYDPNRSALLILVSYKDRDVFKFQLKVAPQLCFSFLRRFPLFLDPVRQDIGTGQELKNISIGSLVFCVENFPGIGGRFIRAAGCFGRVIQRFGNNVQVYMPSGKVLFFNGACKAILGQVSNSDHFLSSLGTAGKNRHKGRRPSVRGVAINPVDHPHGGGEGKGSPRKAPVSPWGRLTIK